MYSLPPYAFLAQDFTTWLLFILTNIFTGFICIVVLLHTGYLLYSDYDPEANKGMF
jgi:photosystem I P700 chlorophyll a apoprotein A2